MGKMDDLAFAYQKHIELPWQRTVAGAQRVIILVYEKELERALRTRLGEFEQATWNAGYKWMEFDCTSCFAKWMAGDEYKEAYFEFPDDLDIKVPVEFRDRVAKSIKEVLLASDEKTVVALTGVASLYGFIRVSDLIQAVEPDIKGRLVVFFPGTKDGNNYQLLDARDGWNYLAYSITLNSPGGAL